MPSITMLTYSLPTKAESPTPNSDSARPVATWFASSESVNTAKTIDNADPAAMPARTPSHGSARRRGDRKRSDGSDEHHPFDAEIQYAGLFGDELAQRREDERRAGGEASAPGAATRGPSRSPSGSEPCRTSTRSR